MFNSSEANLMSNTPDILIISNNLQNVRIGQLILAIPQVTLND